MATKKSSKRESVGSIKNEQQFRDLVTTHSATSNRDSNTPRLKKISTKRRRRVSRLDSPNTVAATNVVEQSVAARISYKSDSARADKVAKTSSKKPGQRVHKRTQTAPQTASENRKRARIEEQKNASAPAKSTRKRVASRTTKVKKLSEVNRTSSKRSTKKPQKTTPDKTSQTFDNKQSDRKSSSRTRATRKTATTKAVSTTEPKQVATRKKTASKASKDPASKRATVTARGQARSVPANARSKTRTNRKPSKKTVVAAQRTKASTKPAAVLTDDVVIGFQGIYYKPYRLSSKDLFMSAAQQDHFMDILTRAKEKLLAEEADRANQLQENDASNLPDPLDQGTNEGVFHNQLRTRDRESQLVRKINRAIDCLKTGSYGYCEACGCEIPIRRLEARPIVTKCIDCKERDELRERQLGQ